MDGELSDLDFDVRMAPAFPTYVLATLFYRVRTEVRPSVSRDLARGLVERLCPVLERHSYATMPVHVRYHWTTAVVRQISGRLTTVIYDSAQHPAAARDINFHFTRDLGLERLVIVAHTKQFAGSAECGPHILLVGAWAAYGARPLPQVQLTPPRHISLHAWLVLSTDGRPLSRQLTGLLTNACADFAALIGIDDSVRGGAPATDVASSASTGGPLRYSLDLREEPVAHHTRARRSTHDASAQRAAAAAFDPVELTNDFIDQTPVPLTWFLSRAATVGLDAATVTIVQDFYRHCDPHGGERATINLARLTSTTAHLGFWVGRLACRFCPDHPLLCLFRDFAARIAAFVRA